MLQKVWRLNISSVHHPPIPSHATCAGRRKCMVQLQVVRIEQRLRYQPFFKQRIRRTQAQDGRPSAPSCAARDSRMSSAPPPYIGAITISAGQKLQRQIAKQVLRHKRSNEESVIAAETLRRGRDNLGCRRCHRGEVYNAPARRPVTYTATVKVSSLRVTARYIVSRSNGTRPASVISRTRSARRIPCGVVAPAS